MNVFNIDTRQLQRYDSPVTTHGSNSIHPPPPTNADVLLIGCGNSGEACALAVQALLYADRIATHTIGINNDTLAPRPLSVRLPDGSMAQLALSERLVLGRDHPRDRLRDYPLLTQRYHRLLRGIPVLETYPQAGHGGHGHPVISALDMDLTISELLAFLRRALHRLDAEIPALPHQSAVQHMIAVQQRQREPARTKQIIICGGGTGSMGNAAHHILPYLVRLLVADLGWSSYDLWGIILGPQAFAGMTPFIKHNYRALLLALDARTRHGWRCQFINDLVLDMRVPPYDRVFLLDDPRLPRSVLSDRTGTSACLASAGTATLLPWDCADGIRMDVRWRWQSVVAPGRKSVE